jgi:hypothetical protein
VRNVNTPVRSQPPGSGVGATAGGDIVPEPPLEAAARVLEAAMAAAHEAGNERALRVLHATLRFVLAVEASDTPIH